jgi:uncharacterized membrane protein YkvI
VSPGLVLAVNLSVAVALLVVAADRRLVRLGSSHSVVLAVLPLLVAVLLTAYVLGEDSYRGHGVSRWEAYASPDGALAWMFVGSLALLVVCAAMLVYAGRRGRDRLSRVTALAGRLTCLVLLTAAILGFSLN